MKSVGRQNLVCFLMLSEHLKRHHDTISTGVCHKFKSMTRAWRGGSEVRALDSQHPPYGSKRSVNPVPLDLIPASGHLRHMVCTWNLDMPVSRTCTDIQ